MQAAVEKARQAQEAGKVFLRQTLERRKREEAKERDRHRTHLERRMKALLSLKENIEKSQVRNRGTCCTFKEITEKTTIVGEDECVS